MDTGFYVGRRLSFEGYLCTVRFHGPLAGTTGLWLGVEWDDTSRGKHDGKHKGEQIFTCGSKSTTGASFIRPTRKPDQERTVLDAIRYKYSTGSMDASSDHDVVVISGKVAEEVGFDKIAREQAELADLRIVLIDQLVVNGIMPRGSPSSRLSQAKGELSAMCPNITELDLGWNTIEHWSQVAAICAALPKITTLKLGYAIENILETLCLFVPVVHVLHRSPRLSSQVRSHRSESSTLKSACLLLTTFATCSVILVASQPYMNSTSPGTG